MKSSGFGFGSHSRGKGYFPDSDWEVAEEISPDPFSEEEHTRIHARRFSQAKNKNNIKTQANERKTEET